MRRKRTALALLLVTACSQSNAAGTTGASPAEKIQRMVAAQGTAEFNLWRASDPGFSPQDINIYQRSNVEGGATVWRAVLPTDHFPPYTVLQKGEVLVRLGGFPSPDIERAADLLQLRATDSASARSVARTLALLADRNGAEEYVIQEGTRSPAESAVLRAWHVRSVMAWRADTVFKQPDGGWISRLTVFSRQTRSYGQDWQPMGYTFVFAADGRLRSWSMRSEDAFQVPIPVR